MPITSPEPSLEREEKRSTHIWVHADANQHMTDGIGAQDRWQGSGWMKIQMMHGRVERFIRWLIWAGEICRADLATVVEEEAQVDGNIEVAAEDVGLDGSAETDCGVKVDEPLQQRAALVVPQARDVELEEVQHIGAHL